MRSQLRQRWPRPAAKRRRQVASGAAACRTWKQCTISILGIILLVLSNHSNAQIGTTVCICAPSVYMMQFNFSQTCDNTALTGAGVVTNDCAIAPFQNDNITDLVPVSVGSIDILELDADLVLFTQSSRFGNFANGETFTYTSVSSNPAMVNVTNFPKALQVSVIGNNAAGETLFFAGLIIFSTECTIYPVLNEGSAIGWVKFIELTDAQNAICPLAPPPSAPGLVPTAAPAPAPVVASGPVPGVVPPPTPVSPAASTVVPKPTRSPKDKTPTRSPKAQKPTRSPKQPSPSSPTRAPAMKADEETYPPACFGGKGKKSKSKGKKSSDEEDFGKGGGKGGKGKENGMGKGDGKGKDKGGVRGNSDSDSRKKKGDKKDAHNIFDNDECPETESPAPSTGGKGKGKGKGKGGNYDDSSEKGIASVLAPRSPAPALLATVKPVVGAAPMAQADSNDVPLQPTQSPTATGFVAPISAVAPTPVVGPVNTTSNSTSSGGLAVPGVPTNDTTRTVSDFNADVTPRADDQGSSSRQSNYLIIGMLSLAVVVVAVSVVYVRRQRQLYGLGSGEKAKLTTSTYTNRY